MVSDFTYTKQDGSGTIALGTDFPAKILRFSLDEYPNAKLAKINANVFGKGLEL